jgi:hypothetical protein
VGGGVASGAGLDRYTLFARVFPVVVVAFPLLLAVSAWIPFAQWPLRLAGGSFVMVVAAFAVAQLARDAGKALEAPMWERWGGPPTARMLRHADSTFDPTAKASIHKQLVKLSACERTPSAAEEVADPENADQIYRVCSDWLRRKALQLKGVSPFDVVHQENITYGYHRNLLGIRRVGIGLALCATLAIAAAFAFNRFPIIELIGALAVGSYVLFGVNEQRLKHCADNYSHRLLSAVDAIPSGAARAAGGRKAKTDK